MNNRKITPRHLWHVALFSAIRGFATAAGSTSVAIIIWWLQNH
jgi:hypothetical protein